MNPSSNVCEIHALIDKAPPSSSVEYHHIATMEIQSNTQWTLMSKFNRTRTKNFIFGGPGYLIFDEDDKMWLTNNVRQGKPNSITFCSILNPNGSPHCFSPLFSGGLFGAGFGIAYYKNRNTVAVCNFGWDRQIITCKMVV